MNYAIIYAGGMTDCSTFTFCDGNFMNSFGYESHWTQRNVPKPTFSIPISEMFIDYNDCFPFKCVYTTTNGVNCTFQATKEQEIWCHIGEQHPNQLIHYKSIAVSSRSTKAVRIIKCVFSCNLCDHQYETRRAVVDHFARTHDKCILDTRIVQYVDTIESTDPSQPMYSKGVIENQISYSGVFICPKDGFHANSMNGLIEHNRTDHLPADHLELKIKPMFYKDSWFKCHPGALTQENRKFDRMLVYGCHHCSVQCSSEHEAFDSIDKVQRHCEHMHSAKPLRFSVNKLVSCTVCKTISTVEGIKAHYQREHPMTKYSIDVKPICERILNHFGFQSTNEDVQFAPKCCRRIQDLNVSRTVNHFINCEKSDFDNHKTYDLEQFLQHFDDMDVILKTSGLVLQFKCIKRTKIGEMITKTLTKDFRIKIFRTQNS